MRLPPQNRTVDMRQAEMPLAAQPEPAAQQRRNGLLPSQRDLFDIPREICFLNAASWSPLPVATQEAGRAAVGRKGRPWLLDNQFAGEQHERARRAAARLINAD